MQGYGWQTGLDACPELSTANEAVFACVAVLPWACTADKWDPTQPVPDLDPAGAKALFGPLLAPWRANRIGWRLWALDGAPRLLEQANRVDVGQAPDQAAALRNEAADELDRCVDGNPRPIRFEPYERPDGGMVAGYPMAAAGLAHLPVPLSDSALGVSAILRVDRTSAALQAATRVFAAPMFELMDGTLVEPETPTQLALPTTGLPERYETLPELWEVTYKNAGSPAGWRFTCVGPSVAVQNAASAPDPVKVSVSAGRPRRELYARLAADLFPLRLWISALRALAAKKPSVLTPGAAFVRHFARLLGWGEDEIVWNGAVATPISILRLFVEEQRLQAWFVAAAGAPWEATLEQDFLGTLADAAKLSGMLASWSAALEAAGSRAHAEAAGLLASAGSPPTITPDLVEAAATLAFAATSGAPAAVGVWACWLAVVVETHSAAPAEAKAFGDKLRDVARWAFARKAGNAEGDVPAFYLDDALRLLNGKLDLVPGFWEDLHASADLVAELKAHLATELATLVSTAVGAAAGSDIANEVRAVIDKAVDLFDSDTNEKQPLPEDPPLTLRLELDRTTVPADEDLRGYAIAVRAGLPKAADPTVTVWQPATWASMFTAKEVVALTPKAALTSGGQSLTFIDTRGATMNDGLPSIDVPYEGKPFHALDPTHVTENTPIRFEPRLYFPDWDRKAFGATPLGFGIRYQAVGATVNNAGVITQPSLRSSTADKWSVPRTLLADGVFGGGFVYLSRQRPALPAFDHSFADDGVSGDTLAHQARLHVEAKRRLGLPPNEVPALAVEQTVDADRVLILYGGAGYKANFPARTTSLASPRCSATIAKRWLVTDALLPATHPFRWKKVAGLNAAAVEKLADAAQDGWVTHPAVRELIVAVSWFDEHLNEETTRSTDSSAAAVRVPLEHVRGGAWVFDERLVVQARRGSARNVQFANGRLTVDVPEGWCAVVRVRNVLEKDYVDAGPQSRLSPHTVDDALYRRDNNQIISVMPAELWVEALPSSVPASISWGAGPLLEAPRRASDPAHLRLLAPAGAVPARWIRGFTVRPKRWRWSGYPVQVPAKGALADWVPLYAGTSNELPVHPDGVFSTRFDATHGWLLHEAAMEPVALRSERVAAHLGIESRPVLRYSALIDPGVAARLAEETSVHGYALVRGISAWKPETRLPPPAWREAVPLTEASLGAEKGMLLLLDDVLYDCADSATLGGVGERIDHDVVATWVKGLDELGTNPIFHPRAALANLKFEMDSPFGLTYDVSLRGNAAQTGLVLRPVGGAGKWLLAKVRLRRYVDPDFRLDDALTAASGEYAVPLRVSDSEWVPIDLAVTCAAAPTGMVMKGLVGADYEFQLPAVAKAEAKHGVRYLVSWHKQRWAKAQPSWRAQVVVQVRDEADGPWRSSGRTSGYEHKEIDPALGSDAAPRLALQGDTPRVNKLLASDYTYPRWLSFIGNFGQAMLGTPDGYKVLPDGASGYKLESTGVPAPELATDATVSPLLLIIRPVPDTMRGRLETDGGELVGAALGAAGANGRFDNVLLRPAMDQFAGCSAVVLRCQYIHVDAPHQPQPPATWNEFVEMMLPDREAGKEAVLRILPEYFGPIAIA